MRQKRNNIHRQDDKRASSHGWRVAIKRNKKTYGGFFSDYKYGGKEQALAKAIEYRDSLLQELGGAKMIGESGVAHIQKAVATGGCSKKKYTGWRAVVTLPNGKTRTFNAYFSTYGDNALERAIEGLKELKELYNIKD
jgi:hypothetical protein